MPRGKKMQTIEQMLYRSQGCTSKEVKKALGWPSVSIPQRAAQLGIHKLYVLKTDTETRYWAFSPRFRTVTLEDNKIVT